MLKKHPKSIKTGELKSDFSVNKKKAKGVLLRFCYNFELEP